MQVNFSEREVGKGHPVQTHPYMLQIGQYIHVIAMMCMQGAQNMLGSNIHSRPNLETADMYTVKNATLLVLGEKCFAGHFQPSNMRPPHHFDISRTNHTVMQHLLPEHTPQSSQML